MLLINKNILLSSATAVFEPHVFTMKGRPFILHTDVVRERAGIFNLHQNIEFLYLAGGSADVRYGEEVLSARAGQIVTVNAHVAHQILDAGDMVYHCLIADNSLFKELDIPVERLCFTPVITDDKANALFDAILAEQSGNAPFRTAGLRAAIVSFALYMCRHHAAEQENERLPERDGFRRVQAAINYIKQHLSSPIRADDLAAHVRLSKYHFLRQFKQVTGRTVTAYLHFLRCEYAKHLLAEQELPIKEIAAMCGFEDSSYFAKIFKKQAGLSPMEYVAALKTQRGECQHKKGEIL